MTDHPAKFTDALLPAARHLLSCVAELPAGAFILDPFAGVGKGVDYLVDVCGFSGHGVELEPEWAKVSPNVEVGDALDLGVPGDEWDDCPDQWDAIFTSPTYGNRMADRDMRESVAGTYAKSLGRVASEGSSCHLQWGRGYQEFHTEAWLEANRVLRSGGWFLLNIKDHYRNKVLQRVPEWHLCVLLGLGLDLAARMHVPTPGNRKGANKAQTVDYEELMLFRKR